MTSIHPTKPKHTQYDDHSSGVEDDDRFNYNTGAKCNDVFWLILFVVHLLALVICAAIYGPAFVDEIKQSDSSFTSEIDDNIVTMIGVLLLSAVTAILVAVCWMLIAKRFPSSIIHLSLGLPIVLNVVTFVFFLILGAPVIALIFLFLAVLTACYAYFMRHRIRFAAVLLELSIKVIQKFSGPLYVAFFYSILECVWVAGWLFTFVAVMEHQENEFIAFAFLVSLYWTQAVLNNIVHVTTAGVAASWWFSSESRSPTLSSLKRASITSLGSICFGSLIVSIISALKILIESSSNVDGESIVRQSLLCLVEGVEGIVEYFNIYTFSRIAMYGNSFLESSKETFDLFKARGFESIVNDNLTGTVLTISAYFGFFSSCSMAVVCGSMKDISVDDLVCLAFVSGVIGYFIVYLFMNVLHSCVATFFITWAEEPAALQISHPQSSLKLASAVQEMYPDVRSGL